MESEKRKLGFDDRHECPAFNGVIQRLLGLQDGRPVASMPSHLTPAILARIQAEEWYVFRKDDGERYFAYVGPLGVFMMDRGRSRCYAVEFSGVIPDKPYVLDGEYVNGKLLVFDVLVYRGNVTRNERYMSRMGMIIEAVRVMRLTLCTVRAEKKLSTTYSKTIPYWDPEVQGENTDGYIFADPRAKHTIGLTDSFVKWKPPEYLTVDLYVYYSNTREMYVACLSGRNEQRLSIPGRQIQVIHEGVFDDEGVYECRFSEDGIHIMVIRHRSDKYTANYWSVAIDVLQSLWFNVTARMLSEDVVVAPEQIMTEPRNSVNIVPTTRTLCLYGRWQFHELLEVHTDSNISSEPMYVSPAIVDRIKSEKWMITPYLIGRRYFLYAGPLGIFTLDHDNNDCHLVDFDDDSLPSGEYVVDGVFHNYAFYVTDILVYDNVGIAREPYRQRLGRIGAFIQLMVQTKSTLKCRKRRTLEFDSRTDYWNIDDFSTLGMYGYLFIDPCASYETGMTHSVVKWTLPEHHTVCILVRKSLPYVADNMLLPGKHVRNGDSCDPEVVQECRFSSDGIHLDIVRSRPDRSLPDSWAVVFDTLAAMWTNVNPDNFK